MNLGGAIEILCLTNPFVFLLLIFLFFELFMSDVTM